MSAHDHDSKYYMKNVRSKNAKDSKFAKESQERTENGYSDEERFDSFVKIHGMAENMTLMEFIQWCYKEDYYFVTPIKFPVLKKSE